MAKAKLGIKRTCLSCNMRFYDFNRSPIICPGCGAEFDPRKLLRNQKIPRTPKGETKEDESVIGVDVGVGVGAAGLRVATHRRERPPRIAPADRHAEATDPTDAAKQRRHRCGAGRQRGALCRWGTERVRHRMVRVGDRREGERT